jgi:hypothetical protein
MEYRAEKFKDIAETKIGRDIWEFLNTGGNVIRMETAVELGKTPAEALAKVLVERFGDDVRHDRIKQAIGHMIRQVMENHGYQLSTQNRKVGNSRLFTKASSYMDGTGLTTKIGYVNRNNQKNLGHQGKPGNDHNNFLYTLQCQVCGREYGCNGSDIFQRKCECQGGVPGL